MFEGLKFLVVKKRDFLFFPSLIYAGLDDSFFLRSTHYSIESVLVFVCVCDEQRITPYISFKCYSFFSQLKVTAFLHKKKINATSVSSDRGSVYSQKQWPARTELELQYLKNIKLKES